MSVALPGVDANIIELSDAADWAFPIGCFAWSKSIGELLALHFTT